MELFLLLANCHFNAKMKMSQFSFERVIRRENQLHEISCVLQVLCKQFLADHHTGGLPWTQSSSRYQGGRMFCSSGGDDVDEKDDDVGHIAATL